MLFFFSLFHSFFLLSGHATCNVTFELNWQLCWELLHSADVDFLHWKIWRREKAMMTFIKMRWRWKRRQKKVRSRKKTPAKREETGANSYGSWVLETVLLEIILFDSEPHSECGVKVMNLDKNGKKWAFKVSFMNFTFLFFFGFGSLPSMPYENGSKSVKKKLFEL